MPLKVIGAGFGRTGTLSLCEALDTLGYSCHHMEKMILDPAQDPSVFENAYVQKSNPDWDSVFNNYDAAVDWPAAAFWEDLLRQYPDAKVILTVRDPENWYASVTKTIRDWPMGAGVTWPERMAKSRRMARTIVKEGVLKNFDDREATIQMFKDHVNYVKATVPPENLLIMHVGDTWEPLCKFLGLEIPVGVPYPHSNRAPNFHKRMYALRDIIEQGTKPEQITPRTLTQLGVDFGEVNNIPSAVLSTLVSK